MTATLQDHIKDFWKYAKTCGKCADLEDIYIEWANSKNLTLNEFKTAYAHIYSSIDTLIQNNKTALNINMEPDEFKNLFSNGNEKELEDDVQDDVSVEEDMSFNEDVQENTPEEESIEHTMDKEPSIELSEEGNEFEESSIYDSFDNEDVSGNHSDDVDSSNEDLDISNEEETIQNKKINDSTLLDILGT